MHNASDRALVRESQDIGELVMASMQGRMQTDDDIAFDGDNRNSSSAAVLQEETDALV